MTIVVGYVPTDPGAAALDVAVAEGKRRGSDLLIVNTAAHQNYATGAYADEKQRDALRADVEAAGVALELCV